MDLATLSGVAFSLGVVILVIGFAAHVGHAVLLANGRRSLQVLAPAPRPAYAGVATGAFVTATTGGVGGVGADDRSASPTPLSSAAVGSTAIAAVLLGIAVLLRGIAVGRGPWGNLYEFSVAFAFSILVGYLLLQRRYPIRSIGFIPVGVATMLALYAASLPSEVKPPCRPSRTRRC